MNAAVRAWAVVPAAGRGSRMGTELPKQYLQLAGRTVLEHTLSALLAHPQIDGATVALSANDPHWPGLESLHGKPIVAVTGGAERADSVLAALRHELPSHNDHTWMLVHDAARPNLHPQDLTRLLEALSNADCAGAILASRVADTLKRADAQQCIAETVDRSTLWRALTPQVFRRRALRQALERAQTEGVVVTDEAMAMERQRQAVQLVEGRADNLKITTPADLELAAFLLQQRLQKGSL